jgi:hypothetical protein
MSLQHIKAIIILAFFLSGTSFAQSLPKGSPELNQLEAMGYEINQSLSSQAFTILSSGDSSIAIDKNSERTAIVKSFGRKKLSEKQEYELLKIVNQINYDLSYQVSTTENFLITALYIHGPYDPKTFAKIIRMIERVGSVLESYKGILDLVN